MADEDIWSSVLYSCTFGGMPIDVISTRDSFKRALVRHEYPGRDGSVIDDEGATARELDLIVLFFDPSRNATNSPPEYIGLNHAQRAAAFVKICNRGEPIEMVHPIFGTFPAMVESCELSARSEDRDQIQVNVRLVEQGLEPVALNAQAVRTVETGTTAVAAEVVTQEAASLPATEAAAVTAVADDAAAQVIVWETDPDLDVRSITVGLQRISDGITDAIRRYELESDPRNYPLYRALSRLHAQVRRAAAMAKRQAPALVKITTASPAPLRVILGDVYGARDAESHMAEVIQTNSVQDPILVPAGTDLVVPTPERINRQGTRRQGPAYGR